MSEQSSNLGFPFLQSGQAQKHVTVNESLLRLDALVQLAVASATTGVQPVSPADGALYIVPAGKTGAAWNAMADHALAYYRDGAWEEITPREGWTAFVKDVDQALIYTGAAWVAFSAAIRVANTDRVLGRASSGAGAAEEIACTAAGRALIDDADASAQRTTLGLGNLATKSDSTSITWTGLPIVALTANPALRVVGSNAEFRWRTNEATSGYMVTASLDDTGVYWETNSAVRGFRWRSAGANILTLGAAGALTTYGHVAPATDNANNLGSASFRYATIYAGTGTINTSDAREKTPLEPIPPSLKRAALRVLRSAGVYQWSDSIKDKGADAARLHVGVTAQAVRDAFLAEGEDPARWALFCADPLTETVLVEEDAEELTPVMQEVAAFEFTHERERVVRKPVMKLAPVVDHAPLIDENGAPVLENGEALQVERPRLELRRFKRARTEARQVLNERGEPEYRLGIRNDQLMWLAMAAIADELRM